jgi:hypothetical protein
MLEKAAHARFRRHQEREGGREGRKMAGSDGKVIDIRQKRGRREGGR